MENVQQLIITKTKIVIIFKLITKNKQTNKNYGKQIKS